MLGGFSPVTRANAAGFRVSFLFTTTVLPEEWKFTTARRRSEALTGTGARPILITIERSSGAA
jgi:hypothetical protein